MIIGDAHEITLRRQRNRRRRFHLTYILLITIAVFATNWYYTAPGGYKGNWVCPPVTEECGLQLFTPKGELWYPVPQQVQEDMATEYRFALFK